MRNLTLASAVPDDSGSDFRSAVRSFHRDERAYHASPRTYKMSDEDILLTADAFDPPAGPPGPIPVDSVRAKASAVFESRFGHLRPDLEREQADAEAERTAATAERKELEKQIADAPELVPPAGAKPPPPPPSGNHDPNAEHDGEGGPVGCAVSPGIRQKLFAAFLLTVILGLSGFAWFNVANLSLDVFDSWPRALVATVPVFFAPWFFDLILNLATKQWPSARPALMFAIVVLGVAAFAGYLFGYYQNVLADTNVFQTLKLPVAPIGLQICSQVTYESCFGTLLVEKFLGVVRSWARRNPRLAELREKRRQAQERYNAADARLRQAASQLGSLDNDRNTFVDLVVRLVGLKWRLRQQDYDSRGDFDAAQEQLTNAKDGQADMPDRPNVVKFLRARKGVNR